MNISELSLKRPVFATVMNLLIILFGIIGYTFLGIRDYPAIDPSVISVSTTYTGASADVMLSQVTEPLEKSINSIQGIRTISSQSSLGSSNISIEFNLGVDLDNAANDVRDKVNAAIRNLPNDITAPPVVSKADASGDFIILLAVQSRSKGMLELSDYAENVLQEKFQTIDQVSSINIFGLKRKAMRVWIKPDLMNAYDISFNDINNAVNNENVDVPAGKITGKSNEFIINSLGRLKNEDDFRRIILRDNDQGIVRLGDVAKVEIGPEIEEQIFRLNCLPVVVLAIIPQPGANYIKIADEFYRRLAQIQQETKNEVELTVTIDNTKYIKQSINEVKETIFIALALVVLVILFFFRNILIALRPLIDIPISLIATFFIMYLFGFSINILTLLAIVLATGLVVDDGIVVTENIFRKLEQGLDIKRAALEGSKEIFFPVIATSITLAVVFLPVIFLQGFVGRLFKEFGVVLASAVLISAFVSLTITPVLNVILTPKKLQHSHGRFYEATEPFFKGLEQGYKFLLSKFLRYRWIAIVLLLGNFFLIYYYSQHLQSELAPLEDRSSIRLSILAAEGTNYDKMSKTSLEIQNYLQDSIPEQNFTFTATPQFGATGSNSAFGRVGFVPPDQRTKSQSQFANELGSYFANKYPDLKVFPIQEQTISVGFSSRGALPVQFVVQNLDLEKLKGIIPIFLDSLKKDKTFQNFDVDLKLNKPELDVYLDRIKIHALGLNIDDVTNAIQAAYSGARTAYFISNGKQYQVITQVERKDRSLPIDIQDLKIKNSAGLYISLSELINVQENSNPPRLNHYNRFPAATFSASLAQGKTIGDGLKAMEKIGADVLDGSFQTSLSGASRDFAESSSNTNFAFFLALILIYFILAAQFESFTDPFIIMVTVPMAICGAFLSLYYTGQTLNIFSQIGMIMLVGLVTKNGILIVDFINHKKLQGMSFMHAVIEGSALRLRPILMTSIATAFGSLPIAFQLGAASSSRQSLGIVVFGGVLFSLVLSLFIVPAIYCYISRKKSNIKNPSVSE